jgi:hypothetical protein
MSQPMEPLPDTAESSPTVLTLKFRNLDLIPSTTFLNEIFAQFGPLIESKTELLEKTKRAKIVFQRRCDADVLSLVELNSLFGDSLQSFRLKICPNTPTKGTGKRGRKRKIQPTMH